MPVAYRIAEVRVDDLAPTEEVMFTYRLLVMASGDVNWVTEQYSVPYADLPTHDGIATLDLRLNGTLDETIVPASHSL